MKIIIFYTFSFFINFISSQTNSLNDEYFYVKKFYLEILDSIIYSSIIQNSVSTELMNLLPLEGQQPLIDNEKITILLSANINIDTSIKTSNLIKGNILTDGSKIIIFYGNSRINENDSFVTIGTILDIDLLINIIINNQISKMNFGISCENSFIDIDKKNISISNPSIVLFNSYSYDFYTVPNIYFGDEPLYKNCKINKDKKYEIICSFSEDEIKRYFFLYKNPVPIYEIIPGCSQKIKSDIFLKFDYIIKNCKEFNEDNNKCKECKKPKYKVTNDGEKCVFTSYFYYLCIGLPLIDIFLIVFYIIIISLGLTKTDNGRTFIQSVVFSIFFTLNLVSFYPYIKKK